ncbi:MAG: hypothetical protein KGR98_11565, partial [Verrucomicrobia bacterium]|nr:hypothetical protein [Verrucomicrobiota bacterium]
GRKIPNFPLKDGLTGAHVCLESTALKCNRTGISSFVAGAPSQMEESSIFPRVAGCDRTPGDASF